MGINYTHSQKPNPEDLKEDLWASLKGAENYRIFLEIYLTKKKLNLSAFARQTGYGRGFPSDVLKGRRRLSAKSYGAFEKALKVPSPGRRLFKYLVAREEWDLFPELDRNLLDQQISEVRTRPWGATRREIKEFELAQKSKNIFGMRNVQKIYAAVGSPLQGASLAELLTRTGCSLEQILEVLPLMEETGLISHHPAPAENNSFPDSSTRQITSFRSKDPTFVRYYPRDLHLFLQAQNQTDLWVKSFKLAAQEASVRIENHLSSESEFFFNSTFCVSRHKLPELKLQLRQTILQFIDDTISSDGDQIINIVLSLFK